MKLKYFLIFLLVMSSYFIINQLNYNREIYNFSISIDSLIPFISWMVYFYFLYFILILIPFFELDNKKVTLNYCIAIIISDLFFIILPTSIYRPETTNFLLNLLYKLDHSYNLFPSLHASLLTISFILLFKEKKYLSYKLLPLFLLSLISTLLIKQHYIIDIISGILLGFIVMFISKKFEKVI